MLEWHPIPNAAVVYRTHSLTPFDSTNHSAQYSRATLWPNPTLLYRWQLVFVENCDVYQLRLFVPIILFGLRAAEPCLLFRERLDSSWLTVACFPEVAHFTKGRRDKRLPLIA